MIDVVDTAAGTDLPGRYSFYKKLGVA